MRSRTAQSHSQSGHGRGGHGAHHDHGAMIADFRGRFLVSLALTAPILFLSPMIQRVLGIEASVSFSRRTAARACRPERGRATLAA